MTTTATSTQLPEVLRRLLEATARGDISALTELVHPDISVEWPQSGERFTGRENALGR